MKRAIGLAILGSMMLAAIASAKFTFSTVSHDTILADSTEQMCSYTTRRRLREITFIYDIVDGGAGVDLDSSKVILVFDGDTAQTTWDTVLTYYSADTANPVIPGLWRIYKYDTATGYISGRLSGMSFAVDSLSIGIFNASDSVASFKAGIIWEDEFN